MGLFGIVKALFQFKRDLKKAIEEEQEREGLYLQMSPEELSALSDESLFLALMTRTERRAEEYENEADAMGALNPSQRVLHSVSLWEMEVNNGGLCQFFVNSSREVAPYISENLGLIGAHGHKKLYDDFVTANGIDLRDLSSFMIEDIDEFEAQNRRYPFDEFDEKFYDMEPLQPHLIRFAREHIADF